MRAHATRLHPSLLDSVLDLLCNNRAACPPRLPLKDVGALRRVSKEFKHALDLVYAVKRYSLRLVGSDTAAHAPFDVRMVSLPVPPCDAHSPHSWRGRSACLWHR